ncbi:MAG: glycerol kinase GlpK [Clostridia bacterium]|nr:glycerol kinase GlpK [Clostridia bacterium]
MKKYIIALDEGTTSARTIIFDKEGNIVSLAQKEVTQIFPKPGYVEQDALEIYASQYATMTEAVFKAGISVEDIAGIGITNQRETTIVWDKTSGKPVYNAIVWQCRRTADICEELKNKGLSDYIAKTTGLIVDAYFSATKIKWILDNVPGAREKAEKGELLFGTVDTWLLWKLSGGRVHITDYTNASRTMLYNINKLCWDEKLLNELNIPISMMPKVTSSSEIYDYVDVLGEKIPVCGIAGDQQAALFGQCCFEKGQAKNTYGTGCFLLMNTGNKPFQSKNGLVTTMAASIKGEKPGYALEGSVFVGGAVIQWLRDELGLIRESSDSEYFASKVKDNGGVYVVPAFAGLGAPYWDMYARGTITGLTRGSGRNHIIRAALESIAYQTNDILTAMQNDTGLEFSSLYADGGASANNLLMQFQADVSNTEVICPASAEATALGAAYLAGLACGFYNSKNELKSLKKEGKRFTPEMEPERRSALLSGWATAVKQTRNL